MPSTIREHLRRQRRLLAARLGDTDPATLLEHYWYLWIGAVVAALQVHVTLRLRDGLAGSERIVLGDSVIFEFVGLHLARGGRLYETIWEVKPPVPFELAWGLATVAPDLYTYHALALGLNALAITVGGVAAAGIVREVTDDTLAGVAAAVAPFAFPRFWWRAAIGLKAKYLVLAFALLSCYWYARERDLRSGAAAALAVGTWQLAVVVPLATLAGVAARRDRWGLARYLAGLVLTGLVVALPVLLWWRTLPEMVVETVFVPLLGTEDPDRGSAIQRLVEHLGPALPVVLLGGVGLLATLLLDRERRRTVALVVAVAGWFLLALLFVDYDTRNDVLPFVAVVCVGVGLAVGLVRDRLAALGEDHSAAEVVRFALVLAVCALAFTSVLTLAGFGSGSPGVRDPAVYDTTERTALSMPYNLSERQQLYWHGLEAPTCRVFVGRTQYELVERLGLSDDPAVRYWEPACGQFGPTWRAVREQYGLGVPPRGEADGVFAPTPEPTSEPTATPTRTPYTPPTLTPGGVWGRDGNTTTTATPPTTSAPTP
jgi:hypothetical protein